MSAVKKPLKAIGLRQAMEIMRQPGSRLVRMYSNLSPEGFAHYVIPGGYVEPDVAEKIKSDPLVVAGEDGLFPKQSQTWRLNLSD